jgi:hypothetical protein
LIGEEIVLVLALHTRDYGDALPSTDKARCQGSKDMLEGTESDASGKTAEKDAADPYPVD